MSADLIVLLISGFSEFKFRYLDLMACFSLLYSKRRKMPFPKIMNTLRLEHGIYVWIIAKDNMNYLITDTENYMLQDIR